jgi:NitT/TauT family transport system substrate-binding protein
VRFESTGTARLYLDPKCGNHQSVATVLRCGVALTVVVVALAVPSGVGSVRQRPPSPGLDRVTLRLRSPAQAEFAGYYAAKALGYYEDFGLDVSIKPGRPGTTPEQAVAAGSAQIGVDWLPSVLATRDTGTDLVSIAQVFARSGMAEIVWKSSGITSIAGLRNKRVGVWCCGNQFELYAALKKHGIDATDDKGVRIVNQAFDLNAFLHHKLDAAAALTYKELGQVLETRDPRTGRLYTSKDLTVFRLQDEGTGMLEDGLFAKPSWLNDNRDAAVRFVAASDRGWIYCQRHVAECTQIVLRYSPGLDPSRQRWQLNEVNQLVWPNPLGIGVMDPAAFKQTGAIALEYKLIKSRATGKAYDGMVATDALTYLKSHAEGIGVRGSHYQPLRVQPTR